MAVVVCCLLPVVGKENSITELVLVHYSKGNNTKMVCSVALSGRIETRVFS